MKAGVGRLLLLFGCYSAALTSPTFLYPEETWDAGESQRRIYDVLERLSAQLDQLQPAAGCGPELTARLDQLVVSRLDQLVVSRLDQLLADRRESDAAGTDLAARLARLESTVAVHHQHVRRQLTAMTSHLAQLERAEPVATLSQQVAALAQNVTEQRQTDAKRRRASGVKAQLISRQLTELVQTVSNASQNLDDVRQKLEQLDVDREDIYRTSNRTASGINVIRDRLAEIGERVTDALRPTGLDAIQDDVADLKASVEESKLGLRLINESIHELVVQQLPTSVHMMTAYMQNISETIQKQTETEENVSSSLEKLITSAFEQQAKETIFSRDILMADNREILHHLSEVGVNQSSLFNNLYIQLEEQGDRLQQGQAEAASALTSLSMTVSDQWTDLQVQLDEVQAALAEIRSGQDRVELGMDQLESVSEAVEHIREALEEVREEVRHVAKGSRARTVDVGTQVTPVPTETPEVTTIPGGTIEETTTISDHEAPAVPIPTVLTTPDVNFTPISANSEFTTTVISPTQDVTTLPAPTTTHVTTTPAATTPDATDIPVPTTAEFTTTPVPTTPEITTPLPPSPQVTATLAHTTPDVTATPVSTIPDDATTSFPTVTELTSTPENTTPEVTPTPDPTTPEVTSAPASTKSIRAVFTSTSTPKNVTETLIFTPQDITIAPARTTDTVTPASNMIKDIPSRNTETTPTVKLTVTPATIPATTKPTPTTTTTTSTTTATTTSATTTTTPSTPATTTAKEPADFLALFLEQLRKKAAEKAMGQ